MPSRPVRTSSRYHCPLTPTEVVGRVGRAVFGAGGDAAHPPQHTIPDRPGDHGALKPHPTGRSTPPPHHPHRRGALAVSVIPLIAGAGMATTTKRSIASPASWCWCAGARSANCAIATSATGSGPLTRDRTADSRPATLPAARRHHRHGRYARRGSSVVRGLVTLVAASAAGTEAYRIVDYPRRRHASALAAEISPGLIERFCTGDCAVDPEPGPGSDPPHDTVLQFRCGQVFTQVAAQDLSWPRSAPHSPSGSVRKASRSMVSATRCADRATTSSRSESGMPCCIRIWRISAIRRLCSRSAACVASVSDRLNHNARKPSSDSRRRRTRRTGFRPIGPRPPTRRPEQPVHPVLQTMQIGFGQGLDDRVPVGQILAAARPPTRPPPRRRGWWSAPPAFGDEGCGRPRPAPASAARGCVPCGIRRRPAQSRSKASVICNGCSALSYLRVICQVAVCQVPSCVRMPCVVRVYRSGTADRHCSSPHPGMVKHPITRVCRSWSPTVRAPAGNIFRGKHRRHVSERCGRNNAAAHHSHFVLSRHDQNGKTTPHPADEIPVHQTVPARFAACPRDVRGRGGGSAHRRRRDGQRRPARRGDIVHPIAG